MAMVSGCMEAKWPWGVVVWSHGEWLYGGKMAMGIGCMGTRGSC